MPILPSELSDLLENRIKLKDYDEEMISKIFYLGSLEDLKITRF